MFKCKKIQNIVCFPDQQRTGSVAMALTLLNVNNDCLLGIFKYLTIPELADVASTCTKFRTIARDAFSHHHKSNRLEIDVKRGSKSLQECIERRRQAGNILRNFGGLVTNLKVIFCYNDGCMGRIDTVAFNLLSTNE